MIKLYNHSNLPENLLIKLLELAQKEMKVTGDIVVLIKRGGARGISGLARKAIRIPETLLLRKAGRPTKKDYERIGSLEGDKLINTDGGYIVLSPCNWWKDSVDCVERLYKIILHEFFHVYEFQCGDKFFGEYNRNWANRPHEIRAVHATNETMGKSIVKPEVQEAILNMAIKLDNYPVDRIGNHRLLTKFFKLNITALIF
jgi:hypothetical protein